ncbi:cytochrome bd quinol oxidase subunit 2 apoprotein [Halorubrum distributum JCM 9100]|uniref:Cytochrome bd quinol oxidase subunit 2 apoprotein n=3 Tax=Halorubrum distributum TaxID=29283 RepID=M0EKS4_9EURY|nr:MULTISPECIES: cytochrome d ubiquinol oxidase subunit II [Halorubrum distributum group]ELZ47693.1 cytochrome bd quinol oxidase subunit 2 apoprotein [Halorubrum distributum JCM 9100]ELZ52742.1 cytochrome bd quinol oxidase subunit 2 apoprotein [Halorubrum distributum JCM 10118]MYL68178.1 cytochrome D ubiquinol oxidase subunit II [Halorubrum terrestre]
MTSAVDALAAGPVFGLPLPELWFALVFAILGTFLFLDGFDFGAGAIFATLREDAAREAVLSAIGPFWDGNEVWLVVFGGALFAAFPSVYAGLFSRHYLLMFGILGALILRGLAPEMYEQRRDERWQRWWGRSFVAGSVLAPFLLGAFAGNWLVGTPRSLTLVGVVTGVTVTALTVVSGAAFLRLKARDALPETVTQIGVGAVAAYLLAVVATLGVLATRLPAGVDALLSLPVLALVAASVALGVGYAVALRRGANVAALAAAAGLTYGLTAVVAVLMYPRIDPATGATVSDAVVSTLPLNLMSIGAALLLPLIATYFAVLYSAFSGPISAEEAY